MKVEIVGAGIAGCTLAIALFKAGIDVAVVEKESEETKQSGWLVLSPEAVQIYHEIDFPEISTVGTPCDQLELHTHNDIIRVPRISQSYTGLSVWRKSYVTALREQCHRRNIPISYNTTYRKPNVSAEDVIVYAAGASSSYLRSSLNNFASIEPGGDSVYYGHTLINHNLTPGTFYFFHHSSGQYGIYPPNDEECLWFTRENDSYPPKNEFNLTIKAVQEEFQSIFIDPLPGPIATININPHQPWHNKNIIGIGDLVHAISPSAGQGANQAIIDAYVLTKLILTDLPTKDLGPQLEALRKPSAEHYYEITRNNIVSFLHTPPPNPPLLWNSKIPILQ